MSQIIDDKSEHCVPFILNHIQSHRQRYQAQDITPPPFFVGLNGVQGAGKTTLVAALQQALTSAPYNLPTVVLSIDDLYLPRSRQADLASSHPSNPLLQHRGQPSTHDVALGTTLFDALANRRHNIRIPSYDKAAFDGLGDRRPEACWKTVNDSGQENSIDVVLFEGWCVGFRALSDAEVEERWQAAKAQCEREGAERYSGQLGKLQLEHVLCVNGFLREYDALTDRLEAFVHIDAEDTQYVYDWRLEQEAKLRVEEGSGMTNEQVIKFVNGYYPAYELYTEALRRGIYKNDDGRQVRLVVGKDRRVKEVHTI